MTPDTPVTELELVVLFGATAPLYQDQVLDRVKKSWTSQAPAPTSTTCFAAIMSLRESGLLESQGPAFVTTTRGHRLLQRAVCGALGAPRASGPSGSLTFPQAMSMATLLPVPTLVTVLRTRLDALDREQLALAEALQTSHSRGDGELRIAGLNFREGLLNAERAFLFTFVGDIEDGFTALGATSLAPSPQALPVR